jgi:hypothetical protein
MKHVYVITHDGTQRVMDVTSSRKRARKAMRRRWDRQYPKSPLVFQKNDWQPYLRRDDGGLVDAPYTVQKFGVL